VVAGRHRAQRHAVGRLRGAPYQCAALVEIHPRNAAIKIVRAGSQRDRSRYPKMRSIGRRAKAD
jgi:hypothetical protein